MFFGQCTVVVRRRRKSWQEHHVRQIDTHACEAGRELHERRDKHHAIQRDHVIFQEIIGDTTRANTTVALTQNVLWRCPAFVLGQVLNDEFRDRFDVLINAPKILALADADRFGESGTHRIDHDKVHFVDDAEIVIDALIRPVV